MKKLVIIVVVVGAIILIGLINRENARQNTEAIEALPEASTENNVPRTRAELEAQQ
jgi:hypothetical protein